MFMQTTNDFHVLDKDTLERFSDISNINEIKALFIKTPYLRFYYQDKDFLGIKLIEHEFIGVGKIQAISVFYAEYEPLATETDYDGCGERYLHYMTEGVQYYLPSDIGKALVTFFARIESGRPERIHGEEMQLDHIRVRQEGRLSFQDHLFYLTVTIKEFWSRVDIRERDDNIMMGVIMNNAEQFSKAKLLWTKHNLDFDKACLIYTLTSRLLTFEERKHNAMHWVIDNYHFYLPIVKDTETYLLNTVYQIQRHKSLQLG